MTDSLHDRVVAALGDQYAIEGEIGRGGMSVVYRARDIRLNRTVAIKVLPPELAYDPGVRMRFTREAQTSAQLAHAHIIPIYDVGERAGIAYFVMALVTGGNLATLLANEPRPPIDEVRRILREIADALDYAHVRGVIHRDIKPDNILLDRDSGRAVVTDFGIARAMESGTRLTATGVAVGTPTYMSPEQAVGEREVDGRSDIYSLGVVGYQMLTGRLPFTAGNSMALLLKHVSERPPAIADLRPDAPRGLREAIERALMKSPDDRWPSAATLREALASDDSAAPAWRADRREPVRYTSPRRGSAAAPRSSAPAAVPVSSGGIVLEQEHLVSLTPEQRADLRLWHGRVNVFDRIKAARGYALMTAGAVGLGIAGFVVGVEDIPPLVLAPIVPIYMSVKLWRRGASLRASGLKLRRVFLLPRAKWAFPKPPKPPRAIVEPNDARLAKLAPRDVLDGPQGPALRRAVEERAAILGIFGKLSKADRAMLPELERTVEAMVERIAQLAQAIHRLDQSFDPAMVGIVDKRISEVEPESASVEGERRLALLRRQRATLQDLLDRRTALAHQLESAGLALGSLRLDLLKVGSVGLAASLTDVTSATQEVRALSREIDVALEAAAEVRGL